MKNNEYKHNKKYIKFALSSMDFASRDKREITTALEFGFEVTVICKKSANDKNGLMQNWLVETFEEPDFTKFRNKLARYANILAFWLVLAKRISLATPDVISAHNIVALTISYISTLFVKRSHRAKLIYDSHEFELGLNANRSNLAIKLISNLECFLMKHCAFSIMVNDSIADEVKRIHKLITRPIVIRNTPNFWQLDEKIIIERRKNYNQNFGNNENLFILMYHGAVIEGRGIEMLIKVASHDKNIACVIMGNGEEKYLDSLKTFAEYLNISNRMLFIPAVLHSEIWEYVGAADVGVILSPAVCENHRLSLPNKFFEDIQSMIPIICPKYEAMEGIIDKYRIGLTCNPEKEEEIVDCIENLRMDSTLYAQLKINLVAAKQDLCWENEKKVLQSAFKEYLS